jgi:hypothetical protein
MHHRYSISFFSKIRGRKGEVRLAVAENQVVVSGYTRCCEMAAKYATCRAVKPALKASVAILLLVLILVEIVIWLEQGEW